nr:restriction endonuclease subunit S [Lentilactobacillus kefiri]
MNVGSIAYKDLGDEISVVSPLYVSFSTKKILNDGFLWNWFKTASFDAQRQRLSAGGVRDTLSFNQLSEMNTMFPTYPEQQKIGSFFKQLDNTIALHQRKLAKLKELKQGYLQKLFPKNGSKFPQLRFSGFADAWEQRKLGEIVEINSGRDYKKLGRGKIPVFGTGGYMLSVNGKLSDRDSVGIGRKGSIDKPQFLSAPFWTVDTLFFMTPKNKNDAKFIFDLSQLIQWKKYDESTGVPSLSKSTISNIPITVTKEDEQNKVSTLFELVDKIIAANQRKVEKLKELKKGYMQKMFC